MIAYSVVMFICSATIFCFAFLLSKGNLHLMRKYEQRLVKDTLAYGRALGKGYFIMSISFAISGIIGLLGSSTIIIVSAVILLFIGIIVAMCYFVNILEKFSGGFF